MRESHGEDRAAARPGLHSDSAVAALDHVVHDGKAQPGAARGAGACLVHAVKTLENMLHGLRRDACTVVLDAQLHLIARPADRHADPAVLPVVFDSIFR